MVWVDRYALDAYAARAGIIGHPGRCFVYIMRSGRYSKVGIADDVAARLARLQLSSPHDVTVGVKYAIGDRRFAQLAERATHDDLKDYRHRGEWFDVDYHIVLESTEWHVKEARKMLKKARAEQAARYSDLVKRYRSDRDFRIAVEEAAYPVLAKPNAPTP